MISPPPPATSAKQRVALVLMEEMIKLVAGIVVTMWITRAVSPARAS